MSEAKMKTTRGNGTPYPKGRRFSNEEHGQSHQIQHDEPCQAIHNQTRSTLEKLLDVHTQVTQTLHQIDTTVLNIHKLASLNHVAAAEVQVFADALANIDANLQDLNTFLRATAERSSSLLSNLDQEPSTTGNHESTPSRRGGKCSSVSPLITDLEFGAISYSPLVATDLLDCESPCDSESLTCTPPKNWTGAIHKSTSFSPLPQTPCMLSPPRSTRVLSTISESPSPLISFTTDSDGQQTPRPEDLLTPEPSTCQNRFVFETPPAHVSNGDDGLFFLQTPGFDVSPPRTCNPGVTAPTGSDDVPPTPVVPSPFRTPGILFECSTESRESSLAGSPAILDDLTTSTVKRLGPRGLEERLWQELAIRKADVLQFDKFRDRSGYHVPAVVDQTSLLLVCGLSRPQSTKQMEVRLPKARLLTGQRMQRNSMNGNRTDIWESSLSSAIK